MGIGNVLLQADAVCVQVLNAPCPASLGRELSGLRRSTGQSVAVTAEREGLFQTICPRAGSSPSEVTASFVGTPVFLPGWGWGLRTWAVPDLWS